MPFGLHKLKDTVGARFVFSRQEEAWNWSCRERWPPRGWTRVLSLPQQQCRGKLSGPKPGAARLLVLDSEGLDTLRSRAYCRQGLHAHGSLHLILIAFCGCCCCFLWLFSGICSPRSLRDHVDMWMPSSNSIVAFAQTTLTITKKIFLEQWFSTSLKLRLS